ncbi:MAG: 8-oxo-dGTP diphosphatase [Clostridia bacterium]|nr:8-oxo-dGTP diphosphatase [Clostridia bacterium]MBQ7407619.1 8-oxo-dGTP diphosphatase [Clostridia bacterium]MBQ8268981.1 8-oxo-dGTP diphosphatase [Clostridia bacterium]MBR2325036.1 8-oxo-dGTP diphosphatase [Clostridia bacterium]
MWNTTLCYIEQDEKYLMLHRVKKKNDMNHDKWIGIGGKLEESESPFDGAKREIFEETGLTVSSLDYRGIVTFVSDEFGTEYMHLFHTKAFEGEIRRDCDEGNLEWIEKKKLTTLPIWEGDKIFLSLLDKDVPFFSLKLCYKGQALISHTLEFWKNA